MSGPAASAIILAMAIVRSFPTARAPGGVLTEARRLMDAAFGGEFEDTDWAHALGGWHVVVVVGTAVAAHAAVVPRRLEFAGRQFDAGYVEAVATAPARQRCGLGSWAMTEIGRILRRNFDVGVLSTYRHSFYERLGWERWQGPTYVRRDGDLVRTPEEDDGIMVLRFGVSSTLALTEPLSCDARAGDDW